MSTRDAIKTILLAGGSVNFPYKRSIAAWMEDLTIRVLRRPMGAPPEYVMLGGEVHRELTADVDAAVDAYCRTVFCPANLALAYRGIRRHQLTNRGFDDLSDAELTGLIDAYVTQHWARDYPEFAAETPKP